MALYDAVLCAVHRRFVNNRLSTQRVTKKVGCDLSGRRLDILCSWCLNRHLQANFSLFITTTNFYWVGYRSFAVRSRRSFVSCGGREWASYRLRFSNSDRCGASIRTDRPRMLRDYLRRKLFRKIFTDCVLSFTRIIGCWLISSIPLQGCRRQRYNAFSVCRYIFRISSMKSYIVRDRSSFKQTRCPDLL